MSTELDPSAANDTEGTDLPLDRGQEEQPEQDSLRKALSDSYDQAAAAEKPSLDTAAADPGQVPGTAANAGVPSTSQPASDMPGSLQGKFAPEKWAVMEPAVKAEFQAYEQRIGALANKYGHGAQRLQAFEAAITPYAPLLQKHRLDPVQAVSGLLETARLLNDGSHDQRLLIIHNLLKQHQIPVWVEQDGTIRIPQPSTSPEILTRLTSLEHKDLTTRFQAAQNAEQEVSTELEAFLADPSHAYAAQEGYPRLMASLIQAGIAKDLQDAYDQAAWQHPKTRLLEIARANQEAAKAAAATTTQARNAAVSVNGNSPGRVARDPSKMSLRDTIADAMDAHS